MSVITTGSNPKLLWEGLNELFGLWYPQYTPQYVALFNERPSHKNYEEDQALSPFALAKHKTEGGSLYFDSQKQSFTSRYTHKEYALGFIVTSTEFEDNLYAEVAPARLKCLLFSLNQTKELVSANIFNRAFSGSYVGGDGVSMCNAAHPIEGGTFANVPVDSNGALAGVDLSEAAIESALIDIKNFRDNRNKRIHVPALKLGVPNELEYDAERILRNKQRPATADRDINAMYQLGRLPQGYVVNTYFDDPNAWFILTECETGLTYFNRAGIKLDHDNEFDTKNGKYSARERYSFGWSDPRAVWGSPGAG